MTGCQTDSKLSLQNTNPNGTSTFRPRPPMTQDWCLNLPALQGPEHSKGHNDGGCCWRKEIPPQKADWVEGDTTPQMTLRLSGGELGRKLGTAFSTCRTFKPRKPSVKLTLETQSHAMSFPCSSKTPLSLPESPQGATCKASDVTTRPVCVASWAPDLWTKLKHSHTSPGAPSDFSPGLFHSRHSVCQLCGHKPTGIHRTEGLRTRAHSILDYLRLETGRCESHFHTYKHGWPSCLPFDDAEEPKGWMARCKLWCHTHSGSPRWRPPPAPALLSALLRSLGLCSKGLDHWTQTKPQLSSYPSSNGGLPGSHPCKQANTSHNLSYCQTLNITRLITAPKAKS